MSRGSGSDVITAMPLPRVLSVAMLPVKALLTPINVGYQTSQSPWAEPITVRY